jgi:hypothetical protein
MRMIHNILAVKIITVKRNLEKRNNFLGPAKGGFDGLDLGTGNRIWDPRFGDG